MNIESHRLLDMLSAPQALLGIVIGVLALLYGTWTVLGWIGIVSWVGIGALLLAHQFAIAPCLDCDPRPIQGARDRHTLSCCNRR